MHEWVRKAAVAAALALLPATAARAEDDPSKFYMFYISGQPKAVVWADWRYCADQASAVLSFNDKIGGGGGGILGALMKDAMASKDRFRMRSAAMRRCMGLLGYDRYAMSEADWRALVGDGDLVIRKDGAVDDARIVKFVEVATGPAPSSGKLPQ